MGPAGLPPGGIPDGPGSQPGLTDTVDSAVSAGEDVGPRRRVLMRERPRPRRCSTRKCWLAKLLQFRVAVEGAAQRFDLVSEELVHDDLSLAEVSCDHQHPVRHQDPVELTEHLAQRRSRKMLDGVEAHHGGAGARGERKASHVPTHPAGNGAPASCQP